MKRANFRGKKDEDADYVPDYSDDESPPAKINRRKQTKGKAVKKLAGDVQPSTSTQLSSPMPSTPKPKSTVETPSKSSEIFLSPVSQSTPKSSLKSTPKDTASTSSKKKHVTIVTPCESDSSMDDLLSLTSNDWEKDLTLEERRRRRAK